MDADPSRDRCADDQLSPGSRTARISARCMRIGIRTGCARWCSTAPSIPRSRTQTAHSPKAIGFDHARRSPRWCKDKDNCDFARNGDPRSAFADLTTSLEHETLPADVHGEKRTLGPGETNIGVATALYAGRKRMDHAGASRGETRPRGRRVRPADALRRLHRPRTGRPLRQPDRRLLRDRLPRRARAADCRRGSSDRRAGRAGRAILRGVERVARSAVHVLAGAVGPKGRTDSRGGRAADPRHRDHRRSRDAVQVRAGTRARVESGHLLTYVGEGHTAGIRPRRLLHRREESTATSPEGALRRRGAATGRAVTRSVTACGSLRRRGIL